MHPTLRALRHLTPLCLLVAGLATGGCDRPESRAAPVAAPAAVSGPRAVLPAVVRIEAIRLQPNQGRMVKSRVNGSGAVISAAGHVITNYHVAEDADFYRCHFTDGSSVEARRVGADPLTDLAVLQLDLAQRPAGAPPLPVARFGDSDELVPGREVFALGSPASLSQSITRGVVSNPALVLPAELRIVLDGENVGLVVRWILHDASIFPGNSGGPLVNERGEIVGINEIGVANLGGAIPGNLAQRIADDLIAHGRVVRGWSGLTVQPRLNSDAETTGVIVADIAESSPAALAGLQPGDVITACNGAALTTSAEKAVADFVRTEIAVAPGATLRLSVRRGEAALEVPVVLVEREPAQGADVELRAWGAVWRNLTRRTARLARLPDTAGAWLESLQPGGAAGQAEPELRRGDVIVAIDREPVANVEALRTITAQIQTRPENARTILVSVRRDGALLNSVVDLRPEAERRPTPQVRRAWLGVSVQPLTAKLASRLGVAAESGVRVTRVHAGTSAATAGLQVGDVLLSIDDQPITARRAEDVDSFSRQVRQFKAGTEVKLGLWRDGARSVLAVTLESSPVPAAELADFTDDDFEFTVRETAFEDRVRLQLDAKDTGLLVTNTIASGWAALAGLRNDDLVQVCDGRPVTSLAEFRAAREAALRSGREWWTWQIRRAGRTLFVELNLKPLRP